MRPSSLGRSASTLGAGNMRTLRHLPRLLGLHWCSRRWARPCRAGPARRRRNRSYLVIMGPPRSKSSRQGDPVARTGATSSPLLLRLGRSSLTFASGRSGQFEEIILQILKNFFFKNMKNFLHFLLFSLFLLINRRKGEK